MLFQQKANEELVRSVYETQMGEKSSGTIDKDGNRMLLSSDYSGAPMVRSKEEGSRSAFNSYVFVQLADSDRSLVFQSLGAIRYLFWLGKPAIVRDEEIDTIKKWLETPDEYDVAIEAIQIGDKITLDSGPFSAQEAIVLEVNKTHYVLVLASLGCVLKMKKK